MDFQLEAMDREERQLKQHNEMLKRRADKFGSAFTPMNVEQFRKYKIKKASQTGNITYLEDVLLNDIKDKEQRKKMIEERKQKFFPQIKVNTAGNFNKKADVDFTQEDIIIRQNAWYLYGVDYMSTEKIRNYFKQNQHFRIEWLNDSSCNIVFNASEQAIDAIKPHVRGTSEDPEKGQTWYQLEDYEVQGVKRQLVCRLATNKDVKNNERTGKDSQYYKWVLNKKRFQKYVKQRAFKEMKKTKGIEKSRGQTKKQAKIKKQIKKQEESSSSSGVNESQSSESQMAQK